MAAVEGPDDPDARLCTLLASGQVAAQDLATIVALTADAFGLAQARVYLADIQQRQLMPLSAPATALTIDDSPGGWAYRTQKLQVQEGAREITAWLPLIDGAERLGVLAVRTPALDPVFMQRSRALAALLAPLITSKRAYKDSVVQRTRTEPMGLPAEMLRALLPPRTIGTQKIVSTAVMEPAYEIGGDAYDHALTQSTLHAAVVDAMGHDLASGLTATVTLAACRNARRTGSELSELATAVDRALFTWLPDQFATAVLAQLDLATGSLRWINCGHPPPLLLRGQRLVPQAMEREPDVPMGLPALLTDAPRQVHQIALEPGDRVLLHTDGITEARLEDGEEFGAHRFAEAVIHAASTGEPAPETLRRLIHSILDASGNQLRDDATILLLEWNPPQP
ncbi:PP2C family protein-serine/threonine phosphatase [Streptomyces sp. NBC_01304]|uniref:PP2C family protein-serine/threonine phosphatase n=1 Tax=Streptomyces sp. NBC_01304 TaxID=2903818 RepID=UPI002E0E23B6|nr:serine/threonine-protein phosphatase [Streptomyces sp. NBC_01304]